MIRSIRPLGNSVLLAPLPPPTASPGGILLAQRYQDDRKRYLVLAVGPGRKTKAGVLIAPEVAPGDRVLVEIDRCLNSKPVDDGTHRLLVDAADIIAKW